MSRLSDGVYLGPFYVRVIRQGSGFVESRIELMLMRKYVNQYGVRITGIAREFSVRYRKGERV